MADRSVELEFNTNLDDIEKQITGLSNKVREIQNKSVPIKVQFDLTDLQTTILSLQNSFNSAMQRISPSTEINNVLSDTKKQLEQARADLDKYTKELDELRAKQSAESNSVWDLIGAGAGDPALVKINELNEKIKEQSDLIAKLGMNYTRQESVATSAANAQIRAQQAATSAIEKEEKKRASAQRKHNTDEILKYQLQLKELIQTYRHGDTSLISKEQAAADRQRILETQEAYREAVKSMGEDPTLKQKIYFLEETSLQALDAISDREKQISKEDAAANSQKTKNEEELRKKRQQARTEMVEGVKSLAKLYSDTINSTVNTIRNGLKTIKSLSADLSTILGIEDVQLNVNSILKQSLSTYAGVFESVNLLDQMYEKDISTMLDWAENQSRAYGIASQNAREYLGQISGMLSNLGIEAEDARETMTINYVKMAGDLASAFNKSTDQAFLAIRSGIAGMTRPLEQFGINLKITALDEWVKSNDKIRKQLGDIAYKDLSEANKQMVRYAYILEKASESQGDFSRTSSSFSNEIKTLKNEWQNLLEVIGKFAVSAFRPVVEWLIKAIQYAKYFVEVLAEVFGWQIDWEQDTVKFYQSETDAVDDNTEAIKKKNKELKKGVKLLDLYELDFGNDKDDDGNGGDDLGPKQNLLEGLADAYKDVDFDFKFNLNEKEMQDIRKFVKDITGTFDSIINFKLLNFPSIKELVEDAIDKFKKRPGEFVLDIVGAIFSLKTLKSSSKIIGSYFEKVFTSDDIMKTLQNPTVADRIKGVGMGIMGLIVTGMGGYNLGQSVANGNSMDALLGAGETIGGVVLTAISGAMVGGIPGLVAGLGLGIITALISYNIGLKEEWQKLLDESLIAPFLNAETMVDLYADNIKSVFGDQSVSTAAFDTYNQSVDTLSSDLNILQTVTLPNAISALEMENGINTENIDALKDAYSKIAEKVKGIINAKTELSNTLLMTTFSTADSTIQPLVGHFSELNQQIDTYLKAVADIELAELSTLQLKKSSGEEYDIARYAELMKKYSTESIAATSEVQSLLEGVKSISVDTFEDYTSYAKAINDATEKAQKLYDIEFENIKKMEEEGLYNPAQAQIKIDKLNRLFSPLNEEISKLQSLSTEQFEVNAAVKYTVGYISENATATRLVELISGEDEIGEDVKTAAKLAFGIETEIKALPVTIDEIPSDVRSLLMSLYDIDPDDPDFINQLLNAYKYTVNTLYTDRETENGTIFGIRSTLKFNTDLKSGTITVDDREAPELGTGIRMAYIHSLENSGFKPVEQNGKIAVTLPISSSKVEMESVPVINVPASVQEKWNTDTAAKIKATTDAAAKLADTSDAAKTTADSYTDKTADAIENDADKLTEATSNAISTAANTEEAKQKGSELGNAYMDGLATAINTNSNYKTALQQLVDGFKNALNSISSNINEWSKHLSDGVAALNIPDDVTFSSLMGILKTNNLNIKPLATGGVIPPNNPFLAMLGDQRSGVNIEAPLTTIQEAVRDVVQPEQNIEVSVYIGNQELRDFVVDTVVDNNLIKG